MNISSNQTVYFGPSSSKYPSVGTVFSSDPISWLWKDGSWYYIEYPVTGGYKRGYIPASVVTGAGSDTSTPNFSALCSGAGSKTVEVGGSTYYGPGSNNYPSAGSVSTGEVVEYLGYTNGGYDFIEYSVGSGSQRKRAFFAGGFGSNNGNNSEEDDDSDSGNTEDDNSNDSGEPVETKMISAQSVLYGPGNNGNSYQSIGSVSAGESVIAIVATEDNLWVQIEYNVGTSGTKKRGYVPVSTTELSSTSNLPHSRGAGTLTATSGGTVYSGPSPSVYYSVGSISAKESVTDLGYEEDGYKLIEYSVTGSSYKKRGYYPSHSLQGAPESNTPEDGVDIGAMSNYDTFKEYDIIPSNLPMGGAIVTQGFNDTDTNAKGHLGYDMQRITEIKPLFAGEVIDVNDDISKANGLSVCVRHLLNPENKTYFYSTYCHMSSISVETGDVVNANSTLGIVGGSGWGKPDEYPPHLHVCVFTGRPETNPSGYSSGEKNMTLEAASQGKYNGYFYGPNERDYPRCGGLRFYDPYGVVTSGAAVIAQYS